MSVDLKILEETVERAVRRALAETRSEDLKILAEAIKVMADYIREGFKIFDDRFNQIDRRFKQIDRRFKAIDNRFEQIDRRLSTLENNVKYLMNAVNELKSAVGATLEDYTSVWLSRWLEERGFKCEIKTRATVFADKPREVDILCLEPLVIGEVTTTIRTVEEAEDEIRKLLENVNAIEKIHGTKHYAKLIAVEVAPEEVSEHLEKRAEELGIVLILGRNLKKLLKGLLEGL
jgi:DNA repair exonuclease SbcCD ATPase subunit